MSSTTANNAAATAVDKSKGSEYDEQHAGYGWLALCVIGMVSSLTLYGITLEYVTSGGRKLHEWSFVFVTCSIYAITAYVCRTLIGEKPTEVSRYNLLLISVSSIASTFTSVRSLRYVIYPVQILFKSCKPVPVMVANIIFGRRYKLTKYVNVIIITCGVALFMGGGDATQKNAGDSSLTADQTLIGVILLSVSLCFDGATGAYEDVLMKEQHMEPFDLMFNIQLGKAVIAFCILIATNGINDFFKTLDSGGFSLILLGLTGALGQVFVFVTISKFGALNCALIGLCRKMLSLVLSFVLYGHVLNAFQTVGLGLSISAMIANFYEKGGKKSQDKHGTGQDITPHDRKEAAHQEKTHLLAPSDDEDEEGAAGDSSFRTVGLDLESSTQTNQGGQEVNLLDMADDDGDAYHHLPDPTVQRQDSSYRNV